MPEYPDIVVYLEALEPRIVGHTLKRVSIASPFLLRTAEPPLASVHGLKVIELRRLGKRICIGLENDLWLVLHLMIAGRLHWHDRPVKASKVRLATFDFDNGSLSLGIDPIGEFSLYLQRRPAGNFDDPASFAKGECIATFRRASMVVGTTVSAPVGKKSEALIGTNVFSAHLIASTPFDFGSGRHDIAEHLGRGITQFGTSAEAPILPTPKGYDLVLPFTGSAIAIG